MKLRLKEVLFPLRCCPFRQKCIPALFMKASISIFSCHTHKSSQEADRAREENEVVIPSHLAKLFPFPLFQILNNAAFVANEIARVSRPRDS